MEHYPILAAYRDGQYVVLIEHIPGDPTDIRLRVLRLVSFEDGEGLPYFAAPSLARMMQEAAAFYAKAMEESVKELEREDLEKE